MMIEAYLIVSYLVMILSVGRALMRGYKDQQFAFIVVFFAPITLPMYIVATLTE